MNKLIVLLLLVSTVIGMAMPSLAEDAGNEAEANGEDSVAVAVEDVAVDASDNSDNSEVASAGDFVADGDAAGDAKAKESSDVDGNSEANGGANDAVVTIDVTGANTADNRISQVLENHGDLLNNADVIALGGNAVADSDADADGNAKNKANGGDSTATSESKAECENSGCEEVDSDSEADVEDSSNAGAAQIASGNAAAESGALAIGGEAETGDVDQSNEVVQTAFALVNNHQMMEQEVEVELDLDTDADAETEIDAIGGIADATTDNDAESENEDNTVET